MKEIKIALVGQPNVGKSYIINSIAGATLHVGNFSGVTVEKKEVEFTRDEYKFKLIDLPGTYSFHPYTPEEKVTKEFLLDEEYDLILNVVDSNQLQKNLTFSFQVADLNKPMIIAFNLYDEYSKKGGEIDTDKFFQLTNIRAENVSAKDKFGLEELFDKTIETFKEKNTPRISYEETIEEEIINVKERMKEVNFDKKFVAIRLFEDDKDIYKKVQDEPWYSELSSQLEESKKRVAIEFDNDDLKEIFFEERLALSKGIVAQTAKKVSKERINEKIDQVLIHPIFGVPIFLFIMWVIFQASFSLGAIPANYISDGFAMLGKGIGSLLPNGLVKQSIVDGVIPAVANVIMFLPNILILFLGINLLEQTGYMARAAYVMDGVLKKFGLQGRAFIPLVSGFGCSVPAYMAARTLKNPKDRIITMLVIGFMSCGARLPIYVLLVSAFFAKSVQGNVLFAIYIGGALIGLIVAKILRVVAFRGEPEPFVMELPTYRFPRVKAILFDLWVKAKIFLTKAGTFIAISAFSIWFLSSFPRENIVKEYSVKIVQVQSKAQKEVLENEMNQKILSNSYIADIGKAIEPIFKPLDLGWKENVAIIAGLAAKETVVSTMSVLYNDSSTHGSAKDLTQRIKHAMPFSGAVALIIIVMFYSPCVAAMGTFYAEVPQMAWKIFYTIYPNVFAYVAAFIAVSLIKFLS